MNSPGKHIDHTLLKSDASGADIASLCEEAVEHGFASVCVPPSYVPQASQLLYGSGVAVCTVIGFPLGYQTTETKVFEARQAVSAGASEIDMVINIGHLKSGMNAEVQADIKAVVDASAGHAVKVILENAYLTDEEKVTACKLSEAAGAHYVKTSTGYAPTGASIADIKLMKASVSPHIKIKSAGGVRTLDSLMEYLDAGISRSGATTTAVMIDEFIERFGRE